MARCGNTPQKPKPGALAYIGVPRFGRVECDLLFLFHLYEREWSDTGSYWLWGFVSGIVRTAVVLLVGTDNREAGHSNHAARHHLHNCIQDGTLLLDKGSEV